MAETALWTAALFAGIGVAYASVWGFQELRWQWYMRKIRKVDRNLRKREKKQKRGIHRNLKKLWKKKRKQQYGEE